MEPFSLFQLFQSLCSNSTPQQPPPPTQDEQVETPPKSEENSSSQDTFLQFLSAHDSRAKRTKKP